MINTNKPVVPKLTDFGEARSSLLQTNTVAQTCTENVYRGSSAYIVPEILTNSCVHASLDDLKMTDIWSLAMIMFHLLNPDAKHPFAVETENDNKVTAV